MQTEKLNLTDDAWTEVLADGGSFYAKGASHAVLICLSEGVPALDADAFHYERHQTRRGFGLSDIPSGTRVSMRSVGEAATITVAR